MPQTQYKAIQPDDQGIVAYSQENNHVWTDLYQRQLDVLPGRACAEFSLGLKQLHLNQQQVPQCHEVDQYLSQATGWVITPVAALIPIESFFQLLANRQFPAATFIRTREEFDYLQEPDIFHEIFGHCPMLMDSGYANFIEAYGKLALQATRAERRLLARLYWYTIEFGLVNTKQGVRAYGGGILSSPKETVYAIDSHIPQRKPFNLLEALRTPYRIDIIQPIYFILEDYQALYQLLALDLLTAVREALELGDFSPAFEAKNSGDQQGAEAAC